ncbi:MAG: ADP-ribosylglycohydrolase family protein [Oscillospiraceae bacterium]|nr:ADP-ribosylglycohydrolase family protein [Oscillospiraceae bacterium]
MIDSIDNASRFIGAFTGFAVGDAFGYPCRELTFEEICRRFEKKGCLRLAVSSKTNTALFTDATQMTLFTTDGILWAALSALSESDTEGEHSDGVNYTEYVFYAYQLWLYTQTKTIAGAEYSWLFDKQVNPYKSKLIRTKGLHQKRFSDPVNVELLSRMRNLAYGKITAPINGIERADSGAVKRVLPAGLFFNYSPELAFRAGVDFSAITHSSPVSYLSAGFYSAVIAELINNADIDTAIERAAKILKTYRNSGEVLAVIEKVQTFLEDENISPRAAISHIGTSDNAAEVLGVALFSGALFEDSYENAIRLAVNHDGQSDVCGAMCGGLLGAYHGVGFIPKKWVTKLSHLRLVEDIAISLVENSYFNEKQDDQDEDPDNSDDFDGSGDSEFSQQSHENGGGFKIDFDDEYEDGFFEN